MNLKRLFSAVGVALTVLISSNAFAWDGERKGFILGGGIGLGVSSYTQTYEYEGISADTDRKSKGAFASGAKIGYAPTDKFHLYYGGRSTIFGTDEEGDKRLHSVGVSTVAASYYLQPQAPSIYFCGGFGFSTWTTPFETDDSDLYGLGFYAGGGYEFLKYWSVELTLIGGWPFDEDSHGKVTMSYMATTVTISVLGY